MVTVDKPLEKHTYTVYSRFENNENNHKNILYSFFLMMVSKHPRNYGILWGDVLIFRSAHGITSKNSSERLQHLANGLQEILMAASTFGNSMLATKRLQDSAQFSSNTKYFSTRTTSSWNFGWPIIQ